MKKIFLAQKDYYVIVDDEDALRVSQYTWNINKNGPKRYYAQGSVSHNVIFLHRFILGLKRGDGKMVDHINRDGLDCRKENLWLVTYSINNLNKGLQKNNTSGYRGVRWHKYNKKWEAHIQKNKISIFIGLYDKKEDAARAYNKKAYELFGSYAYQNIIRTRPNKIIRTRPKR